MGSYEDQQVDNIMSDIMVGSFLFTSNEVINIHNMNAFSDSLISYDQEKCLASIDKEDIVPVYLFCNNLVNRVIYCDKLQVQ